MVVLVCDEQITELCLPSSCNHPDRGLDSTVDDEANARKPHLQLVVYVTYVLSGIPFHKCIPFILIFATALTKYTAAAP